MSFLGADTDELREAGQKCQEGKETTDEVIMFLQALIAALYAASWFTGGASAAYASYLETQVVPWLQKISMALGLFARVLLSQAEAQDRASAGETVDFGSLPRYQTPQLPSQPVTPWDGNVTGGGSGGGSSVPDGAPTGGTTVPDGAYSGIDAESWIAGHDAGRAEVLDQLHGQGHGDGAGLGASGGIGHAAGLGHAGSGGGSTGGGSTGGGGSPGGGDGLGQGSLDGSGDPSIGSSPSLTGDGGGLGGSVPGAPVAGVDGATAVPAADGSSYGAAAGLAGGAAALGLGGAALASRGSGSTGDPEIDRLAATHGRGSRGTEVRELQERLTAAGYDTQGADGVWGSKTQAAYDAYRAANPLPIREGTGFSSPDGFDYQQITGVRGNANVTPEFLRGVEGVAQRLGARPEHLMAAMSFETGGTFAADVRNPRSSATGLIQFMDGTARQLGTTTSDLARMTPTEQLTYVERYFAPYRGRLGDLESVYTTILGGHPSSGSDVLFSQGQRAYGPNRELDVNLDGQITAAEAAAQVRRRLGAGAN